MNEREERALHSALWKAQHGVRDTDAWLEPRVRDEWWCTRCDTWSDECGEPEEHEGHWITLREKHQQEAEDYAYDVWHDEHE